MYVYEYDTLTETMYRHLLGGENITYCGERIINEEFIEWHADVDDPTDTEACWGCSLNPDFGLWED